LSQTIRPTNGFVSIWNLEEQPGRDLMRRIVKRMKWQKGMFRPWNPTKKEIEIWLETKKLNFTPKDNKSSRYILWWYLQRYVSTDLQEDFFCYLSDLLQEWILRLKNNYPTNWIEPVEWITKIIVWLERVNNKFVYNRFMVRKHYWRVYYWICSWYYKSIHCCGKGILEVTEREVH